jgi:hypothetical protein
LCANYKKPPTTRDLPADVMGLLQDFLPHVQEVASAAIDWQVVKFLEVRASLMEGGLKDKDANDVALELVKSGAKVNAPNAIPFGAPGPKAGA